MENSTGTVHKYTCGHIYYFIYTVYIIYIHTYKYNYVFFASIPKKENIEKNN